MSLCPTLNMGFGSISRPSSMLIYKAYQIEAGS